MSLPVKACRCPVDESFDPLSAEFLADPFSVLAALPADGAEVFFAPSIGYYVITRYADIEEVFLDPATYSPRIAQLPVIRLTAEAQQILVGGERKPHSSMLGLSGPPHDRLRRPTARAFSMKRVNALVPFVTATTARLLDRMADAAEFDLVATLAFPLPAYTVFSLLGVPERDFVQLKQWCENRAELYWGRPSPQAQIEIATSLAAHRQYLHDLVTVKAREPGDDLTSDLIAIHREDPERLTQSEIASIIFSLSFAGHETTTGLIGNTIRQLLADRSRWAEVVRRPELIPGAIEETLRYDPSVPVWRRITTRPTVLSGVELPENAKLFLWLAAAHRDAAMFAAPDRFDMGRANASQHLTFGKGAHFCPGANLAKLEAQIVIGELARRYPDLRIAPDQDIAFHPNISFRGPLALRLQTGRLRVGS